MAVCVNRPGRRDTEPAIIFRLNFKFSEKQYEIKQNLSGLGYVGNLDIGL